MKRIILAALVGVLVGMAAPVAGQGVEDAILAATSVVEVRLKDKVRDDCLPNPKAIKNAVELKLIANGIKVVEKDKASYLTSVLFVNLVGFAIKINGRHKGCVITIVMDLSGVLVVDVPLSYKDGKSAKEVAYVAAWSDGTVFTGPKENFQSMVKADVEDYTDEVILEILKARQELFAKYPHMKKNFERLSK